MESVSLPFAKVEKKQKFLTRMTINLIDSKEAEYVLVKQGKNVASTQDRKIFVHIPLNQRTLVRK